MNTLFAYLCMLLSGPVPQEEPTMTTYGGGIPTQPAVN